MSSPRKSEGEITKMLGESKKERNTFKRTDIGRAVTRVQTIKRGDAFVMRRPPLFSRRACSPRGFDRRYSIN